MTNNNDNNTRYSSKRDEYEDWRKNAKSESNDSRYDRAKQGATRYDASGSYESNDGSDPYRYRKNDYGSTTKRPADALDYIGLICAGLGLLTSFLGSISIIPLLLCIAGILLGAIGYRKGGNTVNLISMAVGAVGVVISLIFGLVFGLFFAIVRGFFRLIF